MNFHKKPEIRPKRAEFSSGPCPKRPGWDLKKIVSLAWLGRSHRAPGPKTQINQLIKMTSDLLNIPSDYKVGVVPASNTGAFEMAMWTMLGERAVDMLVWESFGATWATDAIEQLKLPNCRVLIAEYGKLPDLNQVRDNSDICFTLNGTTSGTRVPDLRFVNRKREGLTFCDATSAMFAQDIDWSKLDATTFSWQKSMGSEGAHGMIILSPRAILRLESYKPDRPIPKIFRLTENSRIIHDIFSGSTINTPSMLCIADAIDSLLWIKEIGGVPETIKRSNRNFSILQGWIDQQDWIENLVKSPSARSNTSVCLRIIKPDFLSLTVKAKRKFINQMTQLLESEGVAYDIGGHRDAPPSLRIWCGPTVNSEDLENLLPWLKWAYDVVCK